MVAENHMRKPWWRRVAEKFGLPRGPVALGRRGEAYAARYLAKHGMRIIVRNRRHKRGEIDLIGIEGEFLVFVEVRTRSSDDFMTPEQSIRHDKQKTVQQTVRRLIRRHRTAGLRPRIDVVAIIWPPSAKEPATLRHHRGVIAISAW